MELLGSLGRSAAWAALAAALASMAGHLFAFALPPLGPNQARALWDEARADQKAKRPRDALRSVHRLLRSFPDNPMYLGLEAELYETRRDWKRAVYSWELYFSAAPTPTDACPNLGRAYAKSGRDDAALEADARCLALDPSKSDLRLFHALRLERNQRFAQAERGFMSVLEIAPGYSDAHLGLARLDIERGHPSRALERIAALGPAMDENSDGLLAKAKALAALGPRAEARALLVKAARIAPGYIDVHWTLAKLAREDGDKEAAARHRAEARRLEKLEKTPLW